jgi:hypothetical protein
MMIRELESDPRNEYRQILDALATVLAMGNEVVAVTTKAGISRDSPTMEIVACSNVGHQNRSMSLAATIPSTLREALEGRFLTIVVETRL